MNQKEFDSLRELFQLSMGEMIRSNIPGEQWPFMGMLLKVNDELTKIANNDKLGYNPISVNDILKNRPGHQALSVYNAGINENMCKALRPDLYRRIEEN